MTQPAPAPARRLPARLLAACLLIGSPGGAAAPQAVTFQPGPGDVFRDVPDVGDLGLWLLTGVPGSPLRRAVWNGEPYRGRTLREPINLVLIDRFARTPEQATARMNAALAAAGFTPTDGFGNGQAGYHALLNGELRAQHPAVPGQAYSDGPATAYTHHGLTFGPYRVGSSFVFTGAFNGADHRPSLAGESDTGTQVFNNYMVARESLAAALDRSSVFHKKGYFDLHAIIDTPTETTADSDGCAVVLVARD
ncbi:hypothetical protein [Deinococcus sp.]|uniref:hypothetical protein n=1 Tax=Deinococcus sp. TaxID=47478 RepID=UPI0025C3F29D|nr:hypothetical protein [Deinococcus sp.]